MLLKDDEKKDRTFPKEVEGKYGKGSSNIFTSIVRVLLRPMAPRAAFPGGAPERGENNDESVANNAAKREEN